MIKGWDKNTNWLLGGGLSFGFLVAGVLIVLGPEENQQQENELAAVEETRELVAAQRVEDAKGIKRELVKVAPPVLTDEQKRKKAGKHCLSGWTGANRDVVAQVKGMLRDPDSFEHINTRIYGNDRGEHGLWMEYRARNGFGGMNVERIYARVYHDSCKARVLPGGPGSG